MAAVMLGAASLAYRKAAAKAREETQSMPDTPPWLVQFAAQLPENDSDAAVTELVEATYHKKERLLSKSNRAYERFAWFVYNKITSKMWFEIFILLNILLVAVATGVDLENEERDKSRVQFANYASLVTLGVFTLECILKLITEAYTPWNYFTDHENGSFNCLDFSIVLFSFIFIRTDGSALSALRMLRLIRLVTFVKNVPQLRMIIAGLVDGIKSVLYIVMLLFLVIYIFAILGCILFGENDPARFGGIGIAIVTLFQVSTLASWSGIAYVSWFGCEDYLPSPYDASNSNEINTMTNKFQGFQCNINRASPVATGIFYATYILCTSWVVMSIFIGVISMGMFESYFKFKDESHKALFVKSQAENTMPEQMQIKKDKKSLKYKIEHCLQDETEKEIHLTYYDGIVHKAVQFRDSYFFLFVITLTIILIGIISGIDTNLSLHCSRLNQDNNDNKCKDTPIYITIVIILAQTIFTIECMIKIIAEGRKPWNYFIDSENGSWNIVDFIIVFVGFIEITPIDFFKNFPIVILRLIRLFRVFKLAKPLPRLRSIVEALLSSFTSVGWVCVLIFVFNYIVGCLCVVFLRSNDPFHFGSVGRAMFTVLRMETLDSWDQILYITMYGCKGYPGGYPFVTNFDQTNCDENQATGYYGAVALIFVSVVGAYIVPTVLIGIVSIKFDKTVKHLDVLAHEKKLTIKHLARAKEALPKFFTDHRVEILSDVFDTLDSDSDKTLDIIEASPFFQYALDFLFGIELSPPQCESLFFLVDSNKTTEVGFGEFLSFICILKQMQIKQLTDDTYAKHVFSQVKSSSLTSIHHSSSENRRSSKWDAAMDRVDQDSLDAAWSAIYHSVQGTKGKDLADRIKTLFLELDTDKSGELDTSEIGEGLKGCGVRLNERQLLALCHHMDGNKSGQVSLMEFVGYFQKNMKLQDLQKRDSMLKNANTAMQLLAQAEGSVDAGQSSNQLMNKTLLSESPTRSEVDFAEGSYEMIGLKTPTTNMKEMEKQEESTDTNESLTYLELLEKVRSLEAQVKAYKSKEHQQHRLQQRLPSPKVKESHDHFPSSIGELASHLPTITRDASTNYLEGMMSSFNFDQSKYGSAI